MSGSFASKYSADQRAAILTAYARSDRTALQVASLAAAGKLEHDGEPLPPFELPVSTVRSIARSARRSGPGIASVDLESGAPRDAVEHLRVRLLRAIDRELKQVERRQRAGEVVKGEELRQLGRAQRELAQVPGLRDPVPSAPGAKVNGVRDGGTTRGGIAGPLLADHRSSGGGKTWEPPRLDQPPPVAVEDFTPTDPADGSPGAFVRERVARLLDQPANAPPSPNVGRPQETQTRPLPPQRKGEPDGFDHSRLRDDEDVSSIELGDRGRHG